MARFIINEWLWADSAGENGLGAQQSALRFINALANSDHQIIIIEGTEFDRKAWALCKELDVIVQSIATAYVRQVRQNSDRCLILRKDAVAALPNHLAAAIKPDDQYLVCAQLTAGDAVLVTTDMPLREIAQQNGLPCVSREKFLTDYFGIQ